MMVELYNISGIYWLDGGIYINKWAGYCCW